MNKNSHQVVPNIKLEPLKFKQQEDKSENFFANGGNSSALSLVATERSDMNLEFSSDDDYEKQKLD